MFISLLYIIFTVTSCKNKPAGIMDILDDKAAQITYDLNVFSEEDMSLWNYKKNKIILKGCDVDEITKIMGFPNETINGLNDFDGVILCIRDGRYFGGFIVAGYNNETNEYRTSRGISLGSKKSEIQDVYGDPSEYMLDFNILNYIYKRQNEDYILLREEELNDEDRADYYYIQFQINKDQTVTMITFGDYQFVFEMR